MTRYDWLITAVALLLLAAAFGGALSAYRAPLREQIVSEAFDS